MTGAELLELAKATVEAEGQQLTVRRVPPGQHATTRPVWFMPQPIQTSGDPLVAEGAINVGDPNKHDFRTPGDSDIQQKDVILNYDGNDWRVENVLGSPIQGVRPWLHVYAMRE